MKLNPSTLEFSETFMLASLQDLVVGPLKNLLIIDSLYN